MQPGSIGFYYGFYNLSRSPESLCPTTPLFSQDFSPARAPVQTLHMNDVSLARANVGLMDGYFTARSNPLQRRRESNRLSQRAYRDRKESLRRELEAEIAVCKAKHGELMQSHCRQNEEITRLKAEIAKLMTHIESLRSAQAFELVPVSMGNEDGSASTQAPTYVIGDY